MNEHHVLGLSGGKDSAALAIYMRQQYPQIDVTYYFTDTGKELPEVYEFLAKLEGFLGKPIVRLNPDRDFDFWLREYGHYLPSPNTRWCTRQLKLAPFKRWIRPLLAAGDRVTSYVAIRADEDHREGHISQHDNLVIKMPFRSDGIDRQRVGELLTGAGVGLPTYYSWRSRSGCTFCFFQQKIEWVRLRREHPEAFDEAKRYEKTAMEHGSPFTWSQGESLEALEHPDRVATIEADFQIRRQRERSKTRPNVLRPEAPMLDLDELYLDEDGGGACLVCHK